MAPRTHGTGRRSRWMVAAALVVALFLLVGVVVLLWQVVQDDDSLPQRESMARREPIAEPRAVTVSAEQPPAVSAGFVGSQECRQCHHEIWARFQSHPMSHSMTRVDETVPPEDFLHNTTFTAGRNQYRVERTETGVRHHEIAAESAGKTIYDQAVDVHYAVGSGKRGRSYIIERGGLLFMSPISWYSEKGQGRWDLSPSHPVEGHLRFERRIINLCVSCHVGLANPKAGAADRFQTPPFLEMSIGCERCHGPGKEHVQRHQTLVAERNKDPVVNPSKLDPSRRDAVCYQCHPQGQERVLRYGRTDFDFRPGMHMGDVWAVLLEGTGVVDEDGTTYPGISSRRLNTEVEMQLGQTLAVGRMVFDRPFDERPVDDSRVDSAAADEKSSPKGINRPIAHGYAPSESIETVVFITPRLLQGMNTPQAMPIVPAAALDESDGANVPADFTPADWEVFGPVVPVLKRRTRGRD